MLAYSPCKINLGLNILEKLDNGYHIIESVFYTVPVFDILEIAETEKLILKYRKSKVTGIIPTSSFESNIVHKAYLAVKALYTDLPETTFRLHKQIPFGAGLGAGSANGAVAINLLNNYYNLGLNLADRKAIAKTLGSDCPFFIEPKTSYLLGIGAELSPFELPLADFQIIIIKPNFGISTAEAYQNCKPSIPNHSLKSALNAPFENWKSTIKNDFEPYAMLQNEAIIHIKQIMYKHGAFFAQMSGSGSAVYGLFYPDAAIPIDQFKLQFKDYWFWNGRLQV